MNSIIHRGWFQIALAGIVCFVLIDLTLRFTQNPNYIPSFIMLGSFLVPATFAAYSHRLDSLLNRHLLTSFWQK